MMKHRTTTTILTRAPSIPAAFAALCVLGAPAAAQEASPKPPADGTAHPASEAGGFGGYVMLGGVGVPDYEGSADYTFAPLIAGRLSYQTYYAEIKGSQARFNVSPFAGFEFGPSIGYVPGRGDVSNRRVDDMRNIDGTVDAGAFFRVSTGGLLDPTDELAFKVEALTDLGGVNNGTTVSFGPSYSFSPVERIRLGVEASATYATGNYTDTYFGVSTIDALRSGLSTYKARGGIKDVGVVFNIAYQWSDHWSITGFAGYTRLVGDAADSPIVASEGSANQGIVGTGLAYKF